MAASTAKPGPLRAEFSYVTGGLTWEADYSILAPEKGNDVDIVGWVTMDNQSGKDFQNARIKLMAGDVNKIHGLFALLLERFAHSLATVCA